MTATLSYVRPPGTARAHWIMLAIVASACTLFWRAEHIPGTGGLGFLSDGVTYGAIVKDPARALGDEYYLHRALPSWLVHVGLRGLRQPLVDANIIQGFLALNSALLLVATALWRPIADRLRLGVRARWLGFIALFGNFALLKMPFYYPVFTDASAFALGTVVVFASLSGRQWLLALAALTCSFTWPLGALLAAPLLIWPPGRMSPPASGERASLPTVAAVGFAGAFLAWFVWLYIVRGQVVRASQFAVPVVPGIVWIGIAGAVAYIGFAVRGLLSGVTFRYVLAALRAIEPRGLVLAIAAMLPASVIVAVLGEERHQMGLRQFVGNVVLFSSSRPFLFAISNLVYFGPALLLFFSRRIRSDVAAAVRDLGPGWILLAVATVGLSVNSESRQSIFQYPAAIALLAIAADRRGISARAVWCIAVVALAMSKVWLSINIDPAAMVNTDDPMMAWYYRRFFLNHGPWMSNEAYVINALAVGVAGLAVWWAMRAPPGRSTAFAPPRGQITAGLNP